MAKRFLSNVNINDQYTLPSSDGTSGQIIQTDGAGSLSFIDNAADEARKIIFTVKNKDSISLSKGTVVHASPSANPPSGNIVEVIRADNDDSTKMPAIGILNETLAVDAEGECVVIGSVTNIATNSFTAGDTLYVSDTPGEFTNTKPTANNNLIQKIGIVVKSHATNGSVEVFGTFRSNDVPNQIERNVNFTDNSKLTFGDSTTPDFRIYHEGTDSIIQNYTGSIYIDNNADDQDIVFRSDDGSGGLATYFKLDGSLVNGTTTLGAVNFPDKSKIFMGTGSDFKLYHDGSNSYIENETGNLTIFNKQDDGDIIFASDNGSGGTTEYFKLWGLISSILISKDVLIGNDTAKLKFGAGQDLEIYHDGSHSYIKDTGTGDLKLQASNDIFLLDGSGNVMIEASEGGSVDLFYSGSKKLETTSSGVTVTGIVTSDGLVLGDNDKIRLGNSQDLEIYHNGSHSYIDNGATDFYLRTTGNGIFFKNIAGGGNEHYAKFISNGAVELYYDAVKKFETTSAGVTVTGDTVTTDNFFGDTGTASHRLRSSITTAAVLQVRPLGTRTGITPIIQYRHTETGGVKYLMAGTGGTYFGIYNSGVPTDASSMIRLTADNSNNPSIGIGDSGSGTAHLDIGGNVLITNSGNSYLNGGNVGIGTTSPPQKLTVNGAVFITDDLISPGSAGTYTYNGTAIDYSSNGTRYWSWGSGTARGTFNFIQLENDGTNQQTALSIDSSGDATFTGTITASGGSSNNNDDANILTLNASEHARLLVDTSSTSGHRATLALESNGNELLLTTTGSASELTSVGNLTVTSSATTFTGNVTIGDNSASEIFLAFNSSSTDFALGANGSNFMIGTSSDLDTGNLITLSGANGRLGIGTTSPGEKLDLAGTNVGVKINGTQSSRVYYNRSGTYIWSTGLRSGDTKFHIFDERSGDRVVIDDTGNVGIGTTSPGAKLQVYSTATRDISIFGHGTQAQNNWQAEHAFFISAGQGVMISKANASNNTNRLHLFYSTTNGDAQYMLHDTSSVNKVKLNTNGDSYFNGGNVGINTTSPEEKLHVIGSTLISNNEFYKVEGTTGTNYKIAGLTNGNVIQIGAIDYTSAGTVFAGGDNISITTGGASGTIRIKVASSGNVGIGVTSPGSRRLNVYTNASGNDVGFESTISRTSGSNYSVRGLANGSGATTNIGAFFEATGATTNTALWAYNGRVLLATQNATDYVGIGTSLPTSKLSISGLQAAIDITRGNSGDSKWEFSSDSTALYFSEMSTGTRAYMMTIKETTGNVGIGTTSPANKLTVSASNTGTQITTNPVGKFINTGNSFSKLIVGSDNNNFDAVLSMDNNSTLANTKLRIYIGNGTNATTGHSNDHIVLQGDGNVGIGTTSPAAKLEVNGNIAVNAGQKIQLSGAADSTHHFYHDATTDYDKVNYTTGFQFEHFNSGVHMTINSSGNVGIGVTSPNAKLSLAGGSNINSQNSILYIDTNSYYASGADRYITSSTAARYFQLNGEHIWSNAISGTAGNAISFTERMRINASGTIIGTGTYTAGNSIKIFEAQRSGGAVKSDWSYHDANTTMSFGTSTLHPLSIKTNDTERIRVQNTGNIGINTNNPGRKLTIGNANGSINNQISLLDGGGTEQATIAVETTTANDLLVASKASLRFFTGSTIGNSTTLPTNERMRIASNGDVLMGNTVVNPASGFSNQRGFGYDNSTGNLEVASTSGTAMTIGRNESDDGEILELRKESNIKHSFGSTTSYLLSNVGIGTISPVSTHRVTIEADSSNGTSQLYLKRDSTDQGLYIDAGAGSAIYNSHEGTNTIYGRHIWQSTKGTNTVERMRIESSGNVGIGTTMDINKLDVAGNINVQGGNGSYLTFNNGDANIVINNNGSGRDLSFKTYDGSSNSERMRIDKDGNLGIGTTLPAQKLHVDGHTLISAEKYYYAAGTGAGIGSDASGNLILRQNSADLMTTSGSNATFSGTATYHKIQTFYDGDYTSGFKFSDYNGGIWYDAGNDDLILNGGHANSQMIFNTGGTERMRIDSSGRVGIGLTNPTAKLQVVSGDEQLTNFSGNVTDRLAYSRINSFASTSGTTTGAAALELVGNANGSGHGRHAWIGAEGTSSTNFLTKLKFKIRGETNNGYAWAGSSEAPTIMTLQGDGNVGINTTSPDSKLDVTGGDITVNTTGTGFMNFKYSGSQMGTIGTDGIDLKITANSDLQLLATGNVGIGTSSPQYDLHVVATIGTRVLKLGHGVSHARISTDDASKPLDLQINSQNALRIATNKDIGIGDDTPSYKLDVAGVIRATGDIIAFSDKRVKENIKTIDNSLEKVNKLRGVEFNKKGEDKKSIGVIAQEIEKILPEVVSTDDNGMKSVAYGNITGVLIEAIKELKQEIETLKTQINK